ncbi:methylation-associated defense system protein MAD7 [Streptomyces sp. NPDC055134]
MALTALHSKFHHPGVSHLDYKTLHMDRVLTSLLARLWHRGLPSKLRRSGDMSVDDYVNIFLAHPDVFEGFDREITTRWASTHLLDLVNRGRVTESVAAPRPLQGFTYRFRSPRKSRPYGADEQLYEMLCECPGVREELQAFFFSDVERSTGSVKPGPDTDVETQALLHLVSKMYGKVEDQPDTSKPRKPYPPLCSEPARQLGDDVMRLLYHQEHMPRTVLVDYLKVLFAFHLALYHLRMVKLLPQAVASGAVDPSCMGGHQQQDPGHRCPYRVHLFVDVEGAPDTPAATLAGQSATVWYGRLQGFVKAQFEVKKLDEFAEHMVTKRRKLSYPQGRSSFTPGAALALLGDSYRTDRDNFFLQRVNGILDEEGELPVEVRQIVDLDLSPFDEYVELLLHYKGRYHRGYLVDCLDSLLLKNRPGALLAQPRGTRGERRFVLDAHLLEVLLQISLLRPSPDGNLVTAPMRVDEFLSVLRERYGLYIDRLPDTDGFTGASLDDQVALRTNTDAFLNRLREIGYYQDMSDAYLTQTITPRYTMSPSAGTGGVR